MGFRLEQAQASEKDCKDHHKAWSLFLIFYFGSLGELVGVYICNLLSEKCLDLMESSEVAHPSVEGFIWYSKSVSHNPNFMYV